MSELISSRPDLEPLIGLPTGYLEGEVSRCVETLNSLMPPCTVVLCHGDLKPSNVMVYDNEVPKLIDFELSGVGWRGFDLYKMFRTGKGSRESNMVEFCASYLEGGAGGSGGGSSSKLLVQEAKLFEPVTWLEAGVFFLFAIGEGREGLDKAENDKWEAEMEALARDRIGEYAKCVDGWEGRVEEWRGRFNEAER